jgi:hypothetical protein
MGLGFGFGFGVTGSGSGSSLSASRSGDGSGLARVGLRDLGRGGGTSSACSPSLPSSSLVMAAALFTPLPVFLDFEPGVE